MEPAPDKTPWYLGVPSVLVSLVLLGPLAFPLLWKSRAFSRPWKIFMTAVFTALTVYLLWGTGKIAEYALQKIQEATSPV